MAIWGILQALGAAKGATEGLKDLGEGGLTGAAGAALSDQMQHRGLLDAEGQPGTLRSIAGQGIANAGDRAPSPAPVEALPMLPAERQAQRVGATHGYKGALGRVPLESGRPMMPRGRGAVSYAGRFANGGLVQLGDFYRRLQDDELGPLMGQGMRAGLDTLGMGAGQPLYQGGGDDHQSYMVDARPDETVRINTPEQEAATQAALQQAGVDDRGGQALGESPQKWSGFTQPSDFDPVRGPNWRDQTMAVLTGLMTRNPENYFASIESGKDRRREDKWRSINRRVEMQRQGEDLLPQDQRNMGKLRMDLMGERPLHYPTPGQADWWEHRTDGTKVQHHYDEETGEWQTGEAVPRFQADIYGTKALSKQKNEAQYSTMTARREKALGFSPAEIYRFTSGLTRQSPSDMINQVNLEEYRRMVEAFESYVGDEGRQDKLAVERNMFEETMGLGLAWHALDEGSKTIWRMKLEGKGSVSAEEGFRNFLEAKGVATGRRKELGDKSGEDIDAPGPKEGEPGWVSSALSQGALLPGGGPSSLILEALRGGESLPAEGSPELERGRFLPSIPGDAGRPKPKLLPPGLQSSQQAPPDIAGELMSGLSQQAGASIDQGLSDYIQGKGDAASQAVERSIEYHNRMTRVPDPDQTPERPPYIRPRPGAEARFGGDDSLAGILDFAKGLATREGGAPPAPPPAVDATLPPPFVETPEAADPRRPDARAAAGLAGLGLSDYDLPNRPMEGPGQVEVVPRGGPPIPTDFFGSMEGFGASVKTGYGAPSEQQIRNVKPEMIPSLKAVSEFWRTLGEGTPLDLSSGQRDKVPDGAPGAGGPDVKSHSTGYAYDISIKDLGKDKIKAIRAWAKTNPVPGFWIDVHGPTVHLHVESKSDAAKTALDARKAKMRAGSLSKLGQAA